jgi:MarR family transcriptional regulator, 2-MHQ and catechol-resistance regulon repressor
MERLADERITLVGLLFEAHAAVARATQPTLEAHGLSPQWFEALIRLARSPEQRLRMSELAASMTSITPSGLTRLIDRLEEAGLVQRERCPSDRRGAFAVLTPAGKDKVDDVLPAHLTDLEAAMSGLFDPAERTELDTMLRRIRDAGCRP